MISAINNINLQVLTDSSVSLIAAFVLGGLIGYERQYRQRTAGLRTNVLVSVGAAIFVDMAATLGGNDGAIHVVAYVVSGIGFLGAGVIMREEGNVRGLNTAATLWGSAAVGACAGADMLVEAILGTVVVLAANTLLRPIANRINKQPLASSAVEATHAIYVIAPRTEQKTAMEALISELSIAGYPTRDLDVHAFGSNDVEIEAILAATEIKGEILDSVVKKLSVMPCTTQVFWSADTSE